jgi:hypothetical protein
MLLSAAQRQYLIRDHMIGAAVINFLIGIIGGILAFRHHTPVPMTGDPSIVNDTIGTAIILPIATCLIVTPLVRKAIAHGKVAPLAGAEGSMLMWLPRNTFLRSCALALCCLAWFAPVLLGLLLLAQVHALPLGAYVVIKSTFAAVMAGLVCPVVALYVMATTPLPVASAEEIEPADEPLPEVESA